jgi:hypothetical protein
MDNQINLRSKLINFLNKNCKINQNSEEAILKMNLIITNSFKPKEENINEINNKNKEKELLINPSQTYIKINDALTKITESKNSFQTLNNNIDVSFNKLTSILSSRDELQKILKEFNTKTKDILSSKEKMQKLINSINSIYSLYEETLSIQAFLDNNSSVLKYRFTSDYEKILKGINFFTLNTQYIQSQKYLQTYKTLKITAINKYYEYIENSFNTIKKVENNLLLPPDNESFLSEILSLDELKDYIYFYYLFPNISKMKELITFFENKIKYDNDILSTQQTLKQKYIQLRIDKVYTIYNSLFEEINKNFNNDENTKIFNNNIAIELHKIILHTFLEILHFGELFQHEYKRDVYIIQEFTNYIYNGLYDNIRPIIVSIVSLEDLIILFDAFSSNTGVFFIEVNEDNGENNNKIIEFFYNFFNQKISKERLINQILIFRKFLDISQHLIRPTVLHLIQDIQEKIYFKVSIHVKNNFNEIEYDFPSFGLFEEKLNSNSQYKYFSLFHYFLKRIVILYEIFKSKLDDKILNQIIISSIEIFISILNGEILNKQNLNYEFQIYIIQQILLCLQILNEFKIDTIETEIDIDFRFITDMFKSNYNSIINGQISVGELLSNSTVKILDKTRDFKKILYNNLLKSYKMFINLTNEFIFGRVINDLYHKIINVKDDKEKAKNIVKLLIQNEKEFQEKIPKIEDNKNIVFQKFNEQIMIIDNSVYEKIEKVVKENISNIKNNYKKFLTEYSDEDKDKLENIKKLFEI